MKKRRFCSPCVGLRNAACARILLCFRDIVFDDFAKICRKGNVKRLEVEPYTTEDICALFIKTVEEHGIEIKHENVFRAVLADMVAEFCIASVKDAITTADALVHFADFSGFTPNVDESSLKSMITSWHNDAERSEVK